MSVTIYGQHDGDAIFEDDNGWARVRLDDLDDLHRRASWSGYAHYATRVYDRDAIREVRKDWRRGRLPQLDTCTHDGCEEAAPFELRNARPVCPAHKKD
jgi:hypothetical protein